MKALPPESETSTTTSPTTATSTTIETTTTESTVATVDGKPLLEIPTEWDSDREEVIGRYLLYWQAVDIAFGPPEATPEYGPLEDLADAKAVEDLRGQLREDRANGYVVRSEGTETEHNPRLAGPQALTKTEGQEAILQDCFIDARVLESLDGETIDDAVVTKLTNITMKVIDGEWRVFGLRRADPESDGYEECQTYGEQFE